MGKTTVIRAVASALPRRQVHGFYSEEIRRNGERVGFRAVTFDGRKVTMARVGLPGPRVGKYGVDLGAFERVALPALETARCDGVFVIDELGKMELASARFREAVARIFDSTERVVTTIHVFRDPLTDALKRRSDVERIPITKATRDALPKQLVARLER